jgi:glycosyltransferase involved in cell wall biosynthesis
MKILECIPSLAIGGAEKLVVELCNEMCNENEIILCSFKNKSSEMILPEIINSKISIFYLNKRKGFDIIFFFRFIKFINKQKPDIIHTHSSSINYIYLFKLLNFRKKIKYFHTLHSIATEEQKNIILRYIKKCFFNASIIKPIAISESICNTTIKLYGDKKVSIILNGVSKPPQSKDYTSIKNQVELLRKNCKVFISVGNILPVKNYLLLINVFNKLYDEKIDSILLIIGNDFSEDQSNIHNLKSISKGNIFFLGGKSNVGDYLSLADFYCISSIFEGLPMSLLEAMSYGLPILSTTVGGIPDIIKHGINGFLSPDLSVEKYYEIVNHALSQDKEHIDEITKNNKVLFNKQFNISITSKNYLNLFKE